MGKDKKQMRMMGVDITQLHVREAGSEGEESRTLVGYALKFGTMSVNLTPWSSYRDIYEILEPGCISQEMLDRQDIVFTAFHNREKMLGRWVNGSGTLKLELDGTGLKIECELPKTDLGDEMLELVKRGDITGMSFAYSTDEDDSENCVSYEHTGDKDGREQWVRHVKRIDAMYDVTVAANPAYTDTEISSREALEAIPESFLRKERDQEELAAAQKAKDSVTVMRQKAAYYQTTEY